MAWDVDLAVEFIDEFYALPKDVQNAIAIRVTMLESTGPQLGRPYVDTLYGSDFANMKEMRFEADGGVWRVAFAFDPRRQGILLVAGDKAGADQRRFYRRLVKTADQRFERHLRRLEAH